MNFQLAVKDSGVFTLIEANPRASRTIRISKRPGFVGQDSHKSDAGKSIEGNGFVGIRSDGTLRRQGFKVFPP